MNNDDFPHHEIPVGIIKLSEPKCAKVKNLLNKYNEVGFTDFDLAELALMSLREWRNRDYPIPDGYKRHRSKIMVKIPQDELTRMRLKI